MKTLKYVFALMVAAIMSACGTGSYTISTGLADQAAVSVVAPAKTDVYLFVDGQQHAVRTVAQKAWKKNRNIKQTALNTVVMTPGRHLVEIYENIEGTRGNMLYKYEIFVSAREHKIIEL